MGLSGLSCSAGSNLRTSFKLGWKRAEVMEGKQIEFIIRPDGSVEELVSGIQGPECEAITRAIEEALGNIAERKRTPSYFGTDSEQLDGSVTTSG